MKASKKLAIRSCAGEKPTIYSVYSVDIKMCGNAQMLKPINIQL